jgi:hypothetical protein
MAGELQAQYTTGKTLYAVILSPSGQAWYTVTPAFENINAAHWTSYAITMTEATGTGLYLGTFPTGIVTIGTYSILVYVQAGGSPADTDTLIAAGTVLWSGTAALTPVATDSSGDVFIDSSQDLTAPMKASVSTAVMGATAASWNTAGTIGAKINAAGTASDPWATSLPGSYTSPEAGYILGTESSGGGANGLIGTVNDAAPLITSFKVNVPGIISGTGNLAGGYLTFTKSSVVTLNTKFAVTAYNNVTGLATVTGLNAAPDTNDVFLWTQSN